MAELSCGEQPEGARSISWRRGRAPDQGVNPTGRVPGAGSQVEAMARAVRAAYDKAADGVARDHSPAASFRWAKAWTLLAVPRRPAWPRSQIRAERRRAVQARIVCRPSDRAIHAGAPRATTSKRWWCSAAVTGRDPRSLGEQECSAFELGVPPAFG